MLIQIFTTKKMEATRVARMLWNEFNPRYVEYNVMKNIQEHYYIMEPYEILNDALYAMEQIVDETKDNIGIYYNTGDSDKIYLRLFQGAQKGGENYMYEDEKERLRQKQREANGKSA